MMKLMTSYLELSEQVQVVEPTLYLETKPASHLPLILALSMAQTDSLLTVLLAVVSLDLQ